ncbi:MAG: AbrB/MazE/SpoVT family DNA-binding domain-containing protein [Thermodesulfobacteriota bacterium]|nr:AbrB/MazE/SpoVT family DNA-binding domain-containing protein [Thermodesulfobacteriota bacterium]
MEAIIRESIDGLSIIIPKDFEKIYHLKEQMVFEILTEEEKIILKPQKKTKREKLADKFNSIDLDEFEKYKQETLTPFLNMSSKGMELLDEE